MANPVWIEARRRARDETLELVRLNDPARALLTIGTPVVTVMLLRLLTGRWVLAAALAVVVTIVLGGVIYVAKFFSAPAKIAEEAQAKLSRLAEGEDQAERERRRSVMDRLVELYRLELGDDAPAALRAGLELPPEDWLNEHLGELGEAWTVFNIHGTSYQTFEIVAGEWSYRGRRLGSPAAVKWAAFFDGLGVAWGLAQDHEASAAVGVDFYLPEMNVWFGVTYSASEKLSEGYADLASKSGKRVIVAEGPPAFAKESMSLFGDDGPIAGGRWTWGEDRRDKGVFWLLKLDGSAGICLGGPGRSTEHDREPIIGAQIKAAFEKAKEQAT